MTQNEDVVREVAVIDVGSNSVRLVIYRIEGRAFTPFLNEKVMAGLGRNLNESGRLSQEGVDKALRALIRFKALIDGLGVKSVEVVATAAIRSAGDGPDFVDRVRRETGLTVLVIDGEEEARLSALGVLAGVPDAQGVAGDLGGSSLELVPISDGKPGAGETWRLGPLSLMSDEAFDSERVAHRVDDLLSQSPALAGAAFKGRFYAVGGAWRALARIDIALRRHPLGVLHHHEMSRSEVLKVSEFVRKQSKKSLERFEEAAAKRADTLPYAAVVLERVLAFGQIDRVIISAYGLREGLVFRSLADADRHRDPLIAASETFGAAHARARAFGRALERWVEPTFEALPPVFGRSRDRILRAAAARLADMGAMLHPDQRSEIMFDLVLRAPFVGVSHAERAFLASVVHHRYTRTAPDGQPAFDRLLSEEQRRASAALGATFRLAADVSGRSEVILERFALAIVNDTILLTAGEATRGLMTDQAARRLDALGACLNLPSRIAA